MKYYTYDTKKKKKVKIGEIQGELLIKKVDPSKHFMKVVDGYGIQYQALLDLIGKVKEIIIKETTGNQWKTTPEYWFKHCKVADYGNGKQAFLSLKYMILHRKAKEEPFNIADLFIKKEESQKRLF